jgi:hypothetical protein
MLRPWTVLAKRRLDHKRICSEVDDKTPLSAQHRLVLRLAQFNISLYELWQKWTSVNGPGIILVIGKQVLYWKLPLFVNTHLLSFKRSQLCTEAFYANDYLDALLSLYHRIHLKIFCTLITADVHFLHSNFHSSVWKHAILHVYMAVSL